MGLCFTEDDFVKEKCVWLATLSDGSVVYQDDYRPDEVEPIAWLRLADYIRETGLKIDRLEIKFWTHIEEAAPAGSAGYYWIKGVEAFQGVDRTYNYYVVGSVAEGDDFMSVTKWLVPEILPVEYEVRKIPVEDPLLIWNSPAKTSEV